MRRPILASSCVLLAALATAAPAATDLLAGSRFERDKVGSVPGAPWRPSKPDTMSAVVRDGLPGASAQAWVKLVDGNADLSTSLRHDLPGITEGKLRFRLVNARPGGTLGVYLGTGTAGSAADRVFEFKISGSGSVSIGGGGNRPNTGFKVEPGVEVELFLEFGPEEDGKGSIALGTIENGIETVVATADVPRVAPCTALRFTTDKSNKDSMFYVADVRLEVP